MHKELSFFYPVVVGTMVATSLIANVLSSLVAPFILGPFTLSGGFITFPLMFVLSDVLQDVYGYDKSRKVSWLVAATNIFASLLFLLMYLILEDEKAAGIGDLAKVSYHITVISILAFQLGSWSNDVVFQLIKTRTRGRLFWLQAIMSSVVGEIIDSSCFVLLGLMIVFKLPLSAAVVMIFSQVICKLLVETGMLPITYVMRRLGHSYDPVAYVPTTRFGLFSGR